MPAHTKKLFLVLRGSRRTLYVQQHKPNLLIQQDSIMETDPSILELAGILRTLNISAHFSSHTMRSRVNTDGPAILPQGPQQTHTHMLMYPFALHAPKPT